MSWLGTRLQYLQCVSKCRYCSIVLSSGCNTWFISSATSPYDRITGEKCVYWTICKMLCAWKLDSFQSWSLLLIWTNLFSSWQSIYTIGNVWDEITIHSQSSAVQSLKVKKWILNFIPRFTVHVLIFFRLWLKLFRVMKKPDMYIISMGVRVAKFDFGECKKDLICLQYYTRNVPYNAMS